MNKIDKEKFPNHVAIVPDGNRRWAKNKGLAPWRGHLAGAKKTEEQVQTAFDLGLKCLSWWGGSYNNLTKRAKIEINNLFRIYERYFKKLIKDKEIYKNEVKVSVIGRWQEILPKTGIKAAKELIEKTKNHNKRKLNFFIAYDGVHEMISAIKSIVKETRKDKSIKVTPDLLKEHLWTKDLPPVDLLIRTGSSEFTGLEHRGYKLDEVLQTDWTQLLSPASEIIVSTSSPSSTGNNFVNYYNEPEPKPSRSTGGGGGVTSLIIFNEENDTITAEEALVTWFTNIPATTRVIYDIVSHPDNQLGIAPNYGYAYSTDLDPTKITFHEVLIKGLTPGTQYFWRAVSSISLEVYGKEMSFIIEIPVPIPTPPAPPIIPVVPIPIPVPVPTPSPVLPIPTSTSTSTLPISDIEEIEPEEVIEDETSANLLAAILGYSIIGNYCFILSFFLTLFLILYLIYRRRKEIRDKNNGVYEKKKYYWDLVGILIGLIVLMFLLKCYFLLVPIIITIGYWLYHYYKKDKEQKSIRNL